MGRLDGKVAIVTGAAGGIGWATAARFLAEGARVLLVDVDPKVADVARSLGEGAFATVADISSEADTARYVADAVTRFGGLDVLFANAGIEGVVGPLTEQTVENFDRVLAVNLRGPWLAIKHGAPRIAERGGGSVVVTSSIAGMIGSPGLGAYVASKHGVNGLVRTAAIELAAKHVRVNAVNPGPIENRMMRSVESQVAPAAPAGVKLAFEARIPVHRYGTNEEIAALALFLASDEASYCTGGIYTADGGFTAS